MATLKDINLTADACPVSGDKAPKSCPYFKTCKLINSCPQISNIANYADYIKNKIELELYEINALTDKYIDLKLEPSYIEIEIEKELEKIK